MTINFQHNNLTIEIFNDSAYTDTVDSPTSYRKVLQADADKAFLPNSQHAIHVYEHDVLINSTIILAAGGATGVYDDAALIDNDHLIIRCCNKLYSLTLPELETNWMIEADVATCFSIHKYKDSYISYGELSIARIDRNGKILWSFIGNDIFVCLDGSVAFEMFDHYIALTDFIGQTYKIDYDGKRYKL